MVYNNNGIGRVCVTERGRPKDVEPKTEPKLRSGAKWHRTSATTQGWVYTKQLNEIRNIKWRYLPNGMPYTVILARF